MTANSLLHIAQTRSGGQRLMSKVSDAKSVPLTMDSKQKVSESESIAASSPIRRPTRLGRALGCARSSLRTASRMDSAIESSCIAYIVSEGEVVCGDIGHFGFGVCALV